MLSVNTIKKAKNTHNVIQLTDYKSDSTFQETAQHEQDFSQQVANICRQHQNQKKWILVINSAEQTLNQLSAQSDIKMNQILCVNSNKVNVEVSNIETAFQKENCAAIVLNDPKFKPEQVKQLRASAGQSQTKLFVIEGNLAVH